MQNEAEIDAISIMAAAYVVAWLDGTRSTPWAHEHSYTQARLRAALRLRIKQSIVEVLEEQEGT